MKDWDTRTLHREACDAFTTLSTLAEEGRKLLDEIAELTSILRRLEDFEDVRVVSCNDSTWRPPLATAVVKRFVRAELETRRGKLRDKFNLIRLPGDKK